MTIITGLIFAHKIIGLSIGFGSQQSDCGISALIL